MEMLLFVSWLYWLFASDKNVSRLLCCVIPFATVKNVAVEQALVNNAVFRTVKYGCNVTINKGINKNNYLCHTHKDLSVFCARWKIWFHRMGIYTFLYQLSGLLHLLCALFFSPSMENSKHLIIHIVTGSVLHSFNSLVLTYRESTACQQSGMLWE